ncbi:UNVERIFIED_CONTAM: Polyadenylate-binding protein-interacting protein 7 [Sesamum calycinum]|uniref:Polyadenylate-binding protein-interacting protein 7 n=1 Tax=Sesamum calycinum TaxID=2727403 RepID=A0AAW2LWI2_9LAMI
MSLSGNGGDKKLIAAKATLNPNAAEFVPFALRSPAAGISSSGASSKFATSAASIPGKAILDRSESSISSNSDDEAKQYWHHQLPDDITPDFKVMGISDTQGINNLPFSSLSLTDVDDGSRYTYSEGSSFMLKEQQGLQPSLSKPWEKHILTNDQLLAREEHTYNGNSRHGFLADMSNEHLLENADVSPLEFLASQFPGFAAESLSEVYFANGGDLNLTIEMLTQLELQVDGGLNQTLNSKALSTPNLSALDFPALTETDGQNDLVKFAGADLHQNVGPYRSSGKESTLLFRSSSSIPSREMVLLTQALDQVEMHKSWEAHNNSQARGIYGDRLQNRGSAHSSPVWLETGEAVANMYSEMREEARDHARVRNAYFEQARQAYLIGNKALAKELSIKGQLHNMQMKAAHGKAQESIYRQRNPDMLANGRERMIDLHGLHVSEAIHVLKRELTVLKSTARSADQHLLLYICVGTGHHTRGSRTPARLPTAVQRYLLEEEGLDYSEPQPGSFELSYTELGRGVFFCHKPYMESGDKTQGQCLYKEWMRLQEQELSELLHHSLNLNNSTDTNDAEITELLEKIIQNFQDYCDNRRRLAVRHVSAFFAATWCTSLENSMSWIAGCRPSSFFNLVYALCGSNIDSRLSHFLQDGDSDFPKLSASQLSAIDKLQRRTTIEEEMLTAQMASLQQDMADMPLALIARELSPRHELNLDVKNGLEKFEQAMRSTMDDADKLRINTAKELLKILKPVQALEYIIAAKKLRLCIQSWGIERDREHGGD